MSKKNNGQPTREKSVFVRVIVVILAFAVIFGFVVMPIGFGAFAEESNAVVVKSFETGKLSEALSDAMDGLDRNSVENVAIENGMLSADDYSAVAGLPNVVNVEFAKCTTENGLVPENAMKSKNRLEYISLPSDTKEIGANAFSGNACLVKVSMPSGVETIGSNAFSNCNKLIDIKVPDTVKTIGDGAFSDCKSITSFTIPAGVTEIQANTFAKTGLTEIYVGPDVTSIGADAFADCSALKDVYFYGDKAPALDASSFKNGSLTIHYPDDAEGYDDISINNIALETGFNDKYVEPEDEKEVEETEETVEADKSEESETAVEDSNDTDEAQTETAVQTGAKSGVSIGLLIVFIVIALVVGAGIMFLVLFLKGKKANK